MTVAVAERRTAKVAKAKTHIDETITIETITPAMAARWLDEEVNSRNRNLNAKKVTQYARDMEEGRWEFNNDAICFDKAGVLLNGQHRLSACVMSGKSFKAVVIRNMAEKAQDVMDQHMVRNVSGILQIGGHMRTSRLAGALRALINIKYASEAFNHYRPTASEQVALLKKHPLLEESVAYVDKTSRGISSSLLAAIHYVAKHILKEPDKADAFVQVFASGVPAYPSDPAHALRENALRHADRKTRKSGPLAFYSLIRAWNLFRDDERIMRWNSPKADVVPIKGLKPDLI